jgi:acetyl esterase/lipase
MANLQFSGLMRHRLRSFFKLNGIALRVYGRHIFGRKIADDWNANTEIGIRFWRHQFTVAMNHPNIKVGRAIYNSLQALPDDVYDVSTQVQDDPKGCWYLPKTIKVKVTLLYCHGGGYAFNGPVSEQFAKMLAHHTGARVFMPTYRLTPEHPHPAQAEDALVAWQFLRKDIPAKGLVVIGDSAGGHMALTLLKRLQDRNETQPALCIGLCPWTDIGERGASMQANDRYDLVQGWMALRFGEWLDPDGRYGREALSPINWDFSELAPVYLQVGGREILRDMIVDFAQVQSKNGASVMLDLWGDMMHNFQAGDRLHASSTQALQRIQSAVEAADAGSAQLPSLPKITQVSSGAFSNHHAQHADQSETTC